MTVAEAIDRIQKILDYMESLDADEEELKDIEALRMTIRSLEAWEKVTDEIFELHDNDDAYWNGVSDCWKIIDKHLKGVTE